MAALRSSSKYLSTGDITIGYLSESLSCLEMPLLDLGNDYLSISTISFHKPPESPLIGLVSSPRGFSRFSILEWGVVAIFSIYCVLFGMCTRPDLDLIT